MSKRAITITVAIIIILALAILAFWVWSGGEIEDTGTDTATSQLTGEEVASEAAERPVLGVMIENTEEARPQTGLNSAGIVIEVVTEGGITRQLAFYQEDMPDEVGPIRSLRPYLVDWVMGFDASIAHVGGSGEALELVDERDTKSLDQFEYPEPYYRDDARSAPHNMYASTEDLRNLQEELGHERSQFSDIPRSNTAPDEELEAETITIDYSQPQFETEFRYNEEDNTYTRYLAGEPHTDDATAEPITVENLVVVRVERQGDNIDTISSGDALVFKDGDIQEASWQKDSYDDRIRILDGEGNQVPLNRGDSWFAMLPADRSVDY